MQEIALNRGGWCLSDTYKNTLIDLWWQNGDGDVFSAKPNNVKYGNAWYKEPFDLPPDLLRHLYIDKKFPSTKIGEMFGVSYHVILTMLKKYGISIITNSMRYKFDIPAELLWGMNWGECLTIKMIAAKLGVSVQCIDKRFKEFGIPKNPAFIGSTLFRDNLGMKHCNHCDIYLAESCFQNDRSTPDGLRNNCKKCAYEWDSRGRWVIKQQILFFYSDGTMKCSLCGDKYDKPIDLLCIDHVNGGGCRHRKEKNIHNLTDWLYKNGFPSHDDFRVLCQDCNHLERLRLEDKRIKDKYALYM